MDLFKKIIGPKSKYSKDLPYTYEARVACWEGSDEYSSYIADTICGVLTYLNQRNIRPEEAQIFEIFDNKEIELDIKTFSYSGNEWFGQDDICQSFCKSQYPGHVSLTDCSFSDRDRDCTE